LRLSGKGGAGLGVAYVTSLSKVDKGYSRSLEFNYEQRLPSLPEALSGLGLGMNYTFVESRFAIRDGEPSPQTSASKNTVSASVFYKNNGLNLRLGADYLSRNHWTIAGSAGTDVFSKLRLSVDFGSSPAVNKQVSIYFNGKNLTNMPLTFAARHSHRVIQREFYRQTYQRGANLSF
jgi:hypothetical protein